MVVLQHKLIYHYLANNLGVFAFPIKLTIRISESLPNIIATFCADNTGLVAPTGAVIRLDRASWNTATQLGNKRGMEYSFSASSYANAYKDDESVHPESMACLHLIRY